MRIIFIFCLLFNSSCTEQNAFKYETRNNYHKNEIHYEKVEFKTLLENPENYHNKNIEVNGYFICNRNETAIYFNKMDTKGIWVSFFKNNFINDNGNYLLENNKINTYSNSYAIIRGKYDYEMKGNLSLYVGSISDITYFGSGSN